MKRGEGGVEDRETWSEVGEVRKGQEEGVGKDRGGCERGVGCAISNRRVWERGRGCDMTRADVGKEKVVRYDTGGCGQGEGGAI